MRVVITGATGTIGGRLVRDGGGSVTILTRDVARARRRLTADGFVPWDGTSALDPSVFEGVDVVYHLAGEPVAGGRWTAEKKRRIEESRVRGTRALVDAIARSGARPRLVCASAVGYYGSRGDDTLTEDSAAGEGFLADVCRAWESEAAAAEQHGLRVAMLRIGVVLAREGGALHQMVPLFRTGLAGRLGDGQQWMPWIHIDDVIAMLVRAGRDDAFCGPINAVSPNPVRNAEFTEALAHALHRPAVIPAPAFAVRLAVGELADVLLASQRVLPERAWQAGFSFAHPTIEGALADAVLS